MSLSKDLNTKRICLDYGELDHNIVDPQQRKWDYCNSSEKDQRSE